MGTANSGLCYSRTARPTMLGQVLNFAEDACPVPVVVAEDILCRWRALNQCLTTQTDLMSVRCPAPATDILRHCSRLVPCILAIDQATLARLDTDRFKQTIDFGRSVSVLVRVTHEDPEIVDHLLRLGCMGVVAERTPPGVVGKAIRALAHGEMWANPRYLADFVRGLLAGESSRNLTSREAEILGLISRGNTNREIAEQLFISRETVRWHIRTLYAKIGTHDRTEAAKYAETLEEG